MDDVEGEVVHGEGFVGVVLKLLLGQRQVLCVEVVQLTRQLLVPGLQVRDDLMKNKLHTTYHAMPKQDPIDPLSFRPGQGPLWKLAWVGPKAIQRPR